VIRDLKELGENRIKLERLRNDQVSFWCGSGCVAWTLGDAAFAEPARPAQFLSLLICLLEIGDPLQPHQLRRQFRLRVSTCRRHLQLSTVQHQSRILSIRFALGPGVPADASNQPSGSGPVPKRRQNDNCYYYHQPGHFKSNVLSASGGLEHQPESQVREPTYVSPWVVMGVLA